MSNLSRRSFLQGAGMLFGAGLSIGAWNDQAGAEERADVVIIGAGLGGCAAALAAARGGARVILTEETDWIGGQLTSQAVPPDDNKLVETTGSTATYRELRARIRDYYRRNYPLTEAARANVLLNPGNGGVSRLCHEPRVALAALYEMLAPYLGSSQIRLLINTKAVRVDFEGDTVRSVEVRDLETGKQTVLSASFVIDATETGELLPLAKVEYVTGAESKAQTGEFHAAEVANPADMQAFTCCFPMEYCAGENHVIEKPRDYAFWRDYVPQMTPAWTGKSLSWVRTHPVTLLPYEGQLDVEMKYKREGVSNLWHYRRIVDSANFTDADKRKSVTLVNWPQNDYWLGNLYEVSDEEAKKHLEGGKQLSLSLFYWMQTEAPRPDGGTGFPELRLRPDLVDTEDGLAKAPYIRESRRIQAEFTVLEEHVGKEQRMAKTGLSAEEVRAAVFDDSVGVGFYRIDLHPSSGGINYIDIDSLYFQIPLGALIPKRVENLLPACKNLGVTHITNGCYRLHPVEWNIGEAAGALAAHCLRTGQSPRAVRNTVDKREAFQSELISQGVPRHWVGV